MGPGGSRGPLAGRDRLLGITGRGLNLSLVFAKRRSQLGALQPSCQLLPFIMAAPGVALRGVSPYPEGALRWSDGARGPRRASRGERSYTAKAPAFAQPWGTDHWAASPTTGPLPVSSRGWAVQMVGAGAHGSGPEVPPCHHPRPSSRADAVKVILYLSCCSHGEIKTRAVGMVKRDPNYIYNIKVSAFVLAVLQGFS